MKNIIFHLLCFLSCMYTVSQPRTSPVGPILVPTSGMAIAGELSVQSGAVYYIKGRQSQKVMDVSGASTQPGAQVWYFELNGTIAQKFIAQKVPNSNAYYLRTSTGGHYITLKEDIPTRTLARRVATDAAIPKSYSLIQDVLRNANTPQAASQQWILQKSNEPFCFFISSISNDQMVLQPSAIANGSKIDLVQKNESDLQKWFFKQTTAETNPDSKSADNGFVASCVATLLDVVVATETKNIAQILPEWRGVGENFVPNGVDIKPFYNYKVLEGTVIRNLVDDNNQITENETGVAHEDLGSAHFTHDMDFHVIPDPEFTYLLGIDKGTIQTNIEVEWESGIAQGNDKDKNPAAPFNRRGDSYGFYSVGHKRQSPIWCWPTMNDWVHVEGQWNWDRGHDPIHTEIHPPRFVAIRRNLPDKLESQPGTFFYTTRCDLFANGDGNIIWNNKGFNSFAQKVRMSNNVYITPLRHILPRPNPSSHLQYTFQVQSGDSYNGQPRVDIYENGTADIPEPHVRLIIPWAIDHVSDMATFARTLYLYWDDVASHGVASSMKIIKVNVTLDSLVILDKQEGNDSDPGEYRLFADLGGKWFFLNEYVGVNDILSYGLGRVWDINYSNHYRISSGGTSIPYPRPSDANNIFKFFLSYDLYVPEGKEFRVLADGWEADYIDNLFGIIANPFLSCEEAKKFAEDHFSAYNYLNAGGKDDPVGVAGVITTPVNKDFLISSKGGFDNEETSHLEGTDLNNNYTVRFKVRIVQ